MVDTSICCLYFVSSLETIGLWDSQVELTAIKNTPWGVCTCRDLCPDSIFRGPGLRGSGAPERSKLGSAVDLRDKLIHEYEFRDLFWLGLCLFACRRILEYGGLTAFTSLRLGNFLRWASATPTGFATSLETTFTAQKPCDSEVLLAQVSADLLTPVKCWPGEALLFDVI